MNQPLLSILIPTVSGREDVLNKFMVKHFNDNVDELIYGEYRIIGENLEVIILKDNKEITIGEKREQLYQSANGLFSWQIDDDDDISDNAIELILNSIKSNPEIDCITFEEYCNMDGKEYKSNHSLTYSGWYGDGSHLLHDGFHFHRTPFFKSVIKTSIAQSVPIKHVRFGEDNFWADDLHKHLKTEIHISEQLYLYIHKPTNFNERYGIK
jgi:hypothetical protein